MHQIKFRYVHMNEVNSFYNIQFYVFDKPYFNNLLKFYRIILSVLGSSFCFVSTKHGLRFFCHWLYSPLGRGCLFHFHDSFYRR
jgi:hypothetical protein